MAGSRFAYVKNYELPDPLLVGTFIILRLDGHAFHRFSEAHLFEKPNDERALKLMDQAALAILDEFRDVVLAFGESDEFRSSFLLRRSASLYNRRQAKILTTLTSLFTAHYVYHWTEFFPNTPMKYPPSFDGRIVLYPSAREVRDYFAWRQADTHVNNLYNTAFWALVHQGSQTTQEAHETLRGTASSQKNELLFQRFHINYNSLPERFRKGTVLVREPAPELGLVSSEHLEGLTHSFENQVSVVDRATTKFSRPLKSRGVAIVLLHCDIIASAFWDARPNLLDA